MLKSEPLMSLAKMAIRSVPLGLAMSYIFLGMTNALAQETTSPVPTVPAGVSATQIQPSAFLPGPIRKGDVLSILVDGEPTLSGQQRVSSDGYVTLPLAGSTRMIGLTPGNASESVATLFKKKSLLRNPQVIVTIIGRPERTAFIAGALDKQGRITLGEDTHLDEIVEPAGIMPTSDLSRVIITRGDKRIQIDYQAYRTGNGNPDSGNNPRIEDGDKIYIRARVQVAGTIKVNGEVKSPLITGLTTGMTVVQAIQQAGGVTDLADRDKVTVMRSGKEISVSFKLIQEGQTDKDIALQDKDEIFVRRLEKPKMFYVNGGVVTRAAFTLTSRVTLSDAIASAGGVLDGVNTKKITVQHKDENGGVTTKTYDLKKTADASTVVEAEDIIAVPYPPERQPKKDIMNYLGPLGTILLFLRR